MTKSRRGTVVALAAIIAFAGFGGVAVGAPPGQTVADFAVKVYRGNLPRQEAMVALQRMVPSLQNPEAPLTEASLVKVMNAFGIPATTSLPGGIVDPGRANAALSVIWQSSASGGANTSTGPINLAICQGGGNIWACMACCTQQGGPVGSCSYFCTFGVSPSSP